ncbi:MAG: DivIVA domain-containing protein [Clostridiales bacterium]|nr:DivIVA domain-containing protein [Clostridiales bacterium]
MNMITPLDIENKKFSKQMVNGYSVEEVDEFLDEITVEYERKCKEISEKDMKISQLEKELVHYKTIESTLQNTLVIAQSAADEVKNTAKQQAEQIIKDAEGSARQSLDSLNQSIVLKKREIDEIEKQFDIYKAKMESLLISQLELIKDMKKDN